MGKPHTHNPNTTNTAAVVTIAAKSGSVAIEIEQISFSFNGVPSSAKLLTVESPSGTVLNQWFVTNGGPGPISFSGSCLKGAPGEAMVVRLEADASLKGCVNAIERFGS